MAHPEKLVLWEDPELMDLLHQLRSMPRVAGCVLLAHLAHLALEDLPAQLALQDLRVKMLSALVLVPLDHPALLVTPDPLDSLASQDPKARLERTDQAAKVPQDPKDLLETQANQAPLDHQDLQETPQALVSPVLQDLQGPRDRMDNPVRQERRETTANLEPMLSIAPAQLAVKVRADDSGYSTLPFQVPLVPLSSFASITYICIIQRPACSSRLYHALRFIDHLVVARILCEIQT